MAEKSRTGGPPHKGRPGQRDGSPRFCRVRMEEIDRSDERFSMSFEPDLGRLRKSIERVGILEPLWVREDRRGLHIVSGFRRFDVAWAMKKEEVPVLIWREDEIEDRLAFEMSLHENALTRSLNVVEKGMALGKLLRCFNAGRQELVRTYLPLLGYEPSEAVLAALLEIDGLSVETKRYINRHGVSLANIRRFGGFARDEQESICRFLGPLKAGENVLKEVLTLLQEISRRDGIAVGDLLRAPELVDAVSDRRRSGSQKIEALRRLLKERRYPRLSELEKKFRTWRRGVKLSPHVAVTPPPFFEGDRFRVVLHFESPEEFQSILGELQSLSGKSIKDLFDIKGYDGDTD